MVFKLPTGGAERAVVLPAGEGHDLTGQPFVGSRPLTLGRGKAIVNAVRLPESLAHAGARVINMSVDLSIHGEGPPVPPVAVYCRVIDKPVIRLVSVDHGQAARAS